MRTLILNPLKRHKIKHHLKSKKNPFVNKIKNFVNDVAKTNKKRTLTGEIHRPVFFKVAPDKLKLSPLSTLKKKYLITNKKRKKVNPMKLHLTKMPQSVLDKLPNVAVAGAGYIGTGYVMNIINIDAIKQNNILRLLTEIGISLGLTYAFGLINKKYSDNILTGGLLFTLHDAWNSFQLSNILPISIPQLPTTTTSNTTTASNTSTTSTTSTASTTSTTDDILDINREFSNLVNINNEVF